MLRLGQRVLPDLGDLDPLDNLIGTGGDAARGLCGIFAGGSGLIAGAWRFQTEGLNVLALHRDRHLEYLGEIRARPVARLLRRGRLTAPDQVLLALILFGWAGDPVRHGGTRGAAGGGEQRQSHYRRKQDFHLDLLVGTYGGIQWGESQVFAPRRMTILAYSCVFTIWPSSPSKSTLTV